ncbi:MAG: hypothetical protein LBI54_01350 [Lachnospiraceae bacterium]|jgi:hypothetical protein|nr:hypothetical protein [Lachnospiraceae bacterium]
MVTIINENNRKEMTREQVRKEYDGKWVLLLRISENPYLVMPLAVSDSPYEDWEQGIYEELEEEAQEKGLVTSCMSLMRGTASISGLPLI